MYIPFDIKVLNHSLKIDKINDHLRYNHDLSQDTPRKNRAFEDFGELQSHNLIYFNSDTHHLTTTRSGSNIFKPSLW